MKKLILLIATLFVGLTAVAQYDATNKYGFWSNWSTGASLSIAANPSPFNQSNFGFGVEVELTKQLSNHWYMRIVGGIPYLMNGQDRFGSVSIGAQWYPWKAYGFFLAADAGASFMLDGDGVYTMSNLGLGYSFFIGDHNTIFAEVDAIHNYKQDKYVDIVVRLGYTFRFGPTGIDRAIIAERERIQLELIEHCDSLETTNDNITEDLKMCRIVMKDQGELIIQLQDSIKYLNTTIDSLWRVVDGLVDWNSAPCVVYNVNSSTISKDQRKYVDDIAEMVADEDTIYVYGYADSQSGTEEFNRELSLKRALSLKKALVDRGIPGEKIFTEGKCYDIPIGDSNSAATRKAIVVVKWKE